MSSKIYINDIALHVVAMVNDMVREIPSSKECFEFSRLIDKQNNFPPGTKRQKKSANLSNFKVTNQYIHTTARRKGKSHFAQNQNVVEIFREKSKTLLEKHTLDDYTDYLLNTAFLVCSDQVSTHADVRRIVTQSSEIEATERTNQHSVPTCSCGDHFGYLEGQLVCNKCGKVDHTATKEVVNSYKDICDTRIKSQYAYKKINRFRELLANVQAKESTNIPPQVIEHIKAELAKESHLKIENVDAAKIRTVLKKLSLKAYYEHTQSILSHLNGYALVDISAEIEDKLEEMFKAVQVPYDLARKKLKPCRKNFFAYNYVFYKFFELLDLPEYKCHFALLKSTDKLRDYDRLWKEICATLQWEYIQTI